MVPSNQQNDQNQTDQFFHAKSACTTKIKIALSDARAMGSEGKLLMKKESIKICEGLMIHADLEFDYRAQIGTIF